MVHHNLFLFFLLIIFILIIIFILFNKGRKTVWNELEADKAFKKSLEDPIWKNI